MIKRGDLVKLIGTDGYMPPLESIGTVLTDFDGFDEADVLFPGHPCPNPPGTYWVAARWMLRKLDPPSEGETREAYVNLKKPIKSKQPKKETV